MIKQHMLLALRSMNRSKLFTFINLLSLSIGIAFCLLVYVFLKNELTYNHFHKNADRIYRVAGHYTNEQGDLVYTTLQDHKLVQSFTDQIPAVEQATAFQTADGVWIRNGDDIFNEKVGFVDSTFLRVFSFPWLAGNKNNALDNLNSVVITRDVADKLFGKPERNYNEFLGRSLVFPKGEERNFIVSGILASLPKNSSLTFDMLIRYHYARFYPENDDFFGNCSLYVELKARTAVKAAAVAADSLAGTLLKDRLAEADKYMESLGKKFNFEFVFQPLRDIYLDSSIGNSYEATGSRKYIFVLSSIALLVLVISCINYVMLATGKSMQRFREIGMRKVLGASRGKIAGQFIMEALANAVLATIAGMLFAKILMPGFNTMIQRNLDFHIFNPDAALFLFILLMLVSLIVGLAPSVSINRMNPVHVLSLRKKGRGGARYSSLFVVIQYSLSILLIVAALVIVRQLKFMIDSDPGFNSDNIVNIGLPNDLKSSQINTLRNALISRTDVLSVAESDRNFLWGSQSFNLKNTDGQNIHVRRLRIDPEYIETLGIPLLAGRNLSGKIATDTTMAVLVNETFVKAMGWKDPVGKILPDENVEPDQRPVVVGVVKDFHFDSMRNKIEPLVMGMNPDYNSIWNLRLIDF